MTTIASRDNPRVKRWRELGRDAALRRKEKRVLIEGENLVAAFLDTGKRVEALLLRKSTSAKYEPLASRAGKTPTILADAVFRAIADADTPAGILAESALPGENPRLERAPACVFLEGIQDAGNVGTILRSALAFGIDTAVLGEGCADAWSPKVLRAGAGAQFSMALTRRPDLRAAMREFGGRLVCTVPRGGTALAQADLSGRIGWLFGSEGQGVSAELQELADARITIPMSRGAESLNVAAAAAICFYALRTCAG